MKFIQMLTNKSINIKHMQSQHKIQKMKDDQSFKIGSHQSSPPSNWLLYPYLRNIWPINTLKSSLRTIKSPLTIALLCMHERDYYTRVKFYF